MSLRRILLVEDEPHVVAAVLPFLKQHGFEALAAHDGDDAFRAFQADRPNLVILDLKLPGMSGWDLFREMRRIRPGVPVVMLTSCNTEVNCVLGLEMGADDYVTKPFSSRELVARVHAVLRRAEREPAQPPPARLTYGPVELDAAAFTMCCGGAAVPLTRSEFTIMQCLVRHPARVFTREALIRLLYEGDGTASDRSVDACVKRLRKKVAAVRPGLDPIETRHGFGYKMNHAIESAR